MKSLLLFVLIFGLGLASAGAAEKKTVKKKEPKVFLIGLESASYRYSEPGYVEHAGYLAGLWAEWYWNSAIGDGKAYGNVRFGSLDYTGGLCSTSTGTCHPYTSKTNDIIARLNTRLEGHITPNFEVFGGLGYRYLYDKGEGASFYDRTGNWGFVPLGFNFNFDSGIGRLFFDFEYDWLVYGKFESKLSQAVNTAPDIQHDQNSGYGLVINAGSDFDNYSLALFYELWSLESSAEVQTYIEPKNSSDTIGLKLGYRF